MNDWSELLGSRNLESLEPSAGRELLRALSHQQAAEPQRVFTNRAVRMEKIRHIGFDLDWTLADYDPTTMSRLAFELTLDRLVERYGYPEAILRAEFRTDFCRRGIYLDTEAGTVIKMNRHRYVGRAYRGRRFLDAGERSKLYRREPVNPANKRFHFVDTMFELPEVNIFSEVVEMSQNGSGVSLESYGKLQRDVRQAIDSIHADDTLKERILADLPHYLPRDPLLLPALQRLALGGRRLLLITNSEHYYTDGLCRHLLGDSWRELFDLVVVSAGKPAFFKKRRPFLLLDAEGREQGEAAVPEWGGIYAGGSREALMELLDCHGEQVLYIGDHIYGDVVSSKLASTWRTALVVRELEDELRIRQELSSQQRHLEVLRAELAESGQRMDNLDDVLALYRDLAAGEAPGAADPELQRTQEQLEELRTEHRAMRHHVRRLQARISTTINPCWGSLFKQGSNKSLFGSQVDDFACLYTSRVSNFAFYGRNHYFRVLLDPMMHETSL